MKKLVSGICLLFISVAVVNIAAMQQAMAQDVTVSYQNFYDQLAPYGQWVDDPGYGNVFVPSVPPGFRPYATDGYWAMTDNGNMWVSSEPWGWACYHYGRWTYNGYYGWIWVPGYDWAPAWVAWRSGGGYYGWAPMSPGYMPGTPYMCPENYWVFVDPVNLYRPNVYGYIGRESADIYIGRTAYITNTYGRGAGVYYYGPSREAIEQETHRPVEVYHLSNANVAGNPRFTGNAINVYRPEVNHESSMNARPANVIHSGQHPIERNPQPISLNHETARPEFQNQMSAGHAEPAQHMEQRQEPAQHMQQQRQQQAEPAQHMQQQQRVQQTAPAQHMQQQQRVQQTAPAQHMQQQQRAQPQPQHAQQRPQPQHNQKVEKH